MLKHTRKIKDIYEDIQKKIFYMIPEKWEKLYLYSAITDKANNQKTGELFFYYVPKGVLKKKPINVYEIPNKFNIDEGQYLRLVELLYDKIKELREEFKKLDNEIWSNITLIIQNCKVRVEYDYEILENSEFNSYERHVIWRYKNLGITIEQMNKQDREVIKRYLLGAKTLKRRELYEFGIYVKEVQNIVDYNNTQNYTENQNIEYAALKDNKKSKNQILLSQEEIENMKKWKE